MRNQIKSKKLKFDFFVCFNFIFMPHMGVHAYHPSTWTVEIRGSKSPTLPTHEPELHETASLWVALTMLKGDLRLLEVGKP